MSQAYAEQIIARQAMLEGKASNIRAIHQDCADYIMPRKGNIISERSPGEQQTVQLFDTTAEESLQIAAAGTLSQLTPPGEIWARIRSSDKKASEALTQWFDQESQDMMEEFHDSNFYLAWHETLLDIFCFCTADLYLEEGSKRFFLNFCNTPVGTFVIAEDNEGFVDTIFRKWKWTARQAEQQWGRKNLGTELTKALMSMDPKDADKEFTFIHGVFPRKQDEVREGMVEGKLRPIASVYVCKEDKNVVEEGGYYEMPHAVGRLLRSNGEAWGRGPGTQVLPEVKLVNRMEYDLTLAVEKAVNPAWLSPDDAAYRPDNRPNGVTYYDATRPENKPEQVKNEARIDLGEQKTEQKRERIRRGFFVDMFQMLNRPDVLKHERTAYQISEMLQEKLLLFAPIFARITLEVLSPILQRAFAMRIREGRVHAPPPVDVSNGSLGYKIEYTSKIALAIKAAQDNATVDMVQLCSLMTPFDQSIPMVVKWRDRYRAACRNRGLPAGDLRSDEEIDQMMAQMQQAQDAMKKAELAEKTTKSAQNLGPRAQEIATNALGQFAT